MNFNSYGDPRNFVSGNRRGINGNYAAKNEMSPFPPDTPVGMAYVPFQSWGETNSPEKAFSTGTLFPELCFPFKEGGRR